MSDWKRLNNICSFCVLVDEEIMRKIILLDAYQLVRQLINWAVDKLIAVFKLTRHELMIVIHNGFYTHAVINNVYKL